MNRNEITGQFFFIQTDKEETMSGRDKQSKDTKSVDKSRRDFLKADAKAGAAVAVQSFGLRLIEPTPRRENLARGTCPP